MKARIIKRKEFIEFKKYLSYDHKTGIFTWKCDRYSNKVKNKIAGRKNEYGYWIIALNRKLYRAHRIAWFLYYGDFDQKKEIDHIDGNRSNNKISNLRLATKSQNQINSKIRKSNNSGAKGVIFIETCKKWFSYLGYKGKIIPVGYFLTFDEAKKAVMKKRIELHGEFANHG